MQTERKNEEWKAIDGYQYEVSDMGRVRKMNSNKCLKGSITRDGYRVMTLTNEMGQRRFQLHRLVAEAFIPNPEKKPQVDHINCQKLDNSVHNLRWCTPKENANNPITLERVRKARLKRAMEDTNIVYVYNDNLQLVTAYTSTNAVKKDGLSQGNVVRCCMGELKRYKGLIFSYKPLFSMDERIAQEEGDKATERRKTIKKQNNEAMTRWLSIDGNRQKLNEASLRAYYNRKLANG